MNMLESVISIFAPHNCISCGYEGEILCKQCWPKLGLLPPSCYICHKTTIDNSICDSCSAETSLNQVWIRSSYSSVPKELIRLLKFNRAKAVSSTLATALTEIIPTNYQGTIVSIPTASSRRRQRGYDQAILIAKELARLTSLPYAPLLIRKGQSRQVGTQKAARASQIHDAFRIRTSRKLDMKQAILVDDVLTTGSTLEAAAKTLKNAGVQRVDAVVFARA